MRRSAAIAMLLLVVPVSVLAQSTMTLLGAVTDNGKPAPGITVRARTPGVGGVLPIQEVVLTTTTAADGSYQLKLPKPAFWTVFAEADGYERSRPASFSVDSMSGNLHQDFEVANIAARAAREETAERDRLSREEQQRKAKVERDAEEKLEGERQRIENERQQADQKRRETISTASTVNKWVVSTTKDQMSDKPIVTAVLKADEPIKGWLKVATPSLVVRCHTPPADAHVLDERLPVQTGLEVYVVTGMAAAVENSEGKHMIRVRLDDASAEQWGTGESTDKEALFIAPIYATRIVLIDRRLRGANQMLIQFTPFNASPVIIKFDTRGFAKHADRVMAACPKVDQSKWMLPK